MPSKLAAAADYQPGTPSTYLFDTLAASAGPLSAAKVTPKSGWALLPEDDLTHKFRGDAVILNDRLALVLRSAGTGAEVYGQTSTAPKFRVEVSPRTASGQRPTALASVQIIENGPAAVALTATFALADGSSCTLKYRISAGQMIVETRLGQGTDRVAVLVETRYLVIPDYFGDDLVYQPKTISRPRLRLPTENMLLSLLDAGNAEVMCVWSSSKQEAVALQSKADPAASIPGYEIQAAGDKPIWIACLEGTGLWYEETAPQSDKEAQAPDWKPPFPAKWHTDFTPCLGQGASLWVSDIRAVTPIAIEGTPIIVYAMDRSQATPLTTFTPIDILRATLGVGPCQYILQTEGLMSESNATPDNVMTWVEKQFQRKKEKKAADEIRERLGQMVEQVRRTDTRLHRYRQIFENMQQFRGFEFAWAKPLPPAPSSTMHDVPATDCIPVPNLARQLAEDVTRLIGNQNAVAECEKLGEKIRYIGDVQNRELAIYRMKARWLRQSAIMLVEGHPEEAELAKQLQAKADEMLETK
jgi:hypothetical protein